MNKHYPKKLYHYFFLFLLFNLVLFKSYSQDTFHVADKVIHFKPPTTFENGLKYDKLKNFIRTFTYGNNVTIAFYLKKDNIQKANDNLDIDFTNQIKIFIPQNLVGKDLSTTSINSLYSSTIKMYSDDNDSLIQKKGETSFNKKLEENGFIDRLTLNKPVLVTNSIIDNKTFYLILANSGYLNNDATKKMVSIQSMIVKIVQGQIIFTIYQQELTDIANDLKKVKEITNEVISNLY